MKSQTVFNTIFLFLFLLSSSQAQVDTISVYSKSMDKNLKAAVFKPDSYAGSKNNYPY